MFSWWIIVGLLVLGWGVFAIIDSIVTSMWEPSTGGAAMIVTIIGAGAVALGLLILKLAGAF